MSVLKLKTPSGGSISVSPVDTAAHTALALPATSGTVQIDSYTPSSAISRTVDGKLRETVSVTDFGAVANGSSDEVMSANVVAIAAAINSGARRVLFPDGTYYVDSTITATVGGVELYGNAILDGTAITVSGINETGKAILKFQGQDLLSTTATASLTAGDKTIALTSVAGIQAGDLMHMSSGPLESLVNGAGDIWYLSAFGPMAKFDHNVVRKITGSTVTMAMPAKFSIEYNIHGNLNVNITRPLQNIKITGLQFVSTSDPDVTIDNGEGLQGIQINRCSNVSIEDCDFENLQGYAVFAARSASVRVSDCNCDGMPAEVDYDEGVASGYSGFTAYKCLSVSVLNCTSYRARHLQDATYSSQLTTSGCSAVASHRAPYRTHQGCSEVVWSGNTGGGAGGILNGGWDFSAVGNFLTSYTADAGISDGLLEEPADLTGLSDSLPANVSVSGNTIIATNRFDVSNPAAIDYESGGVGMLLSGIYKSLSVTGNSISSYLKGIGIGSLVLKSASITGNSVSAYSSGTGEDDFNGIGIGFTYSTNTLQRSNINVSNNVCSECYGGVVYFTGGASLEAPADNIIISNNISTGTAPAIRLYEGYFGEMISITGNTQPAITSVVSIATHVNFLSYPQIDNRNASTTSSSGAYVIGTSATDPDTLSARTVREGAVVLNSVLAPSGVYGWIAVNAGTTGTLTGVTATTTAGSATVTFSDVTNLFVGMWVSLSSVDRRIISLSGAVATLSSSMASSATLVTVSYRSPNFKAISTLAA